MKGKEEIPPWDTLWWSSEGENQKLNDVHVVGFSMTSQTAIGGTSPAAFFLAAYRAEKSQRLIIAGQFFLSFFSRCTSRDLQQRKKALSFFFSWRSRDVQRRKKARKKAQCVATFIFKRSNMENNTMHCLPHWDEEHLIWVTNIIFSACLNNGNYKYLMHKYF